MKYLLLTLCLAFFSNANHIDLSSEVATLVEGGDLPLNRYGPWRCRCYSPGCNCQFTLTGYPAHTYSGFNALLRLIDYNQAGETFSMTADGRLVFPPQLVGPIPRRTTCDGYYPFLNLTETTASTRIDRRLVLVGDSSSAVDPLCTANGLNGTVVDYIFYVYLQLGNAPTPTPTPTSACMDSRLSLNCRHLALMGACDASIPSSVASSAGLPCRSLSVRDVCPQSCRCCSVDGKCVCDMKYLMYGMNCQTAVRRFSCNPQSMMGSYLWKLCPCTCKRAMTGAPESDSGDKLLEEEPVDDLRAELEDIAPGKGPESVVMSLGDFGQL